MRINNLEDKLDGKIPITREELLVLVNSWGRLEIFNTFYQNETSNPLLVKKASNNQILMIDKCEATQSEQTGFVRKECYDLSKLDTSEITNMSSVFRTSNFNGDISNWNTSNVTSMLGMFNNARTFNQELHFNTSNVTNMSAMFFNALNFNQPIKFDTSNVTNMSAMFFNALNFNQPLNFDTSNVTNMKLMFGYAESFNQILNFDTSNVINMEWMFDSAKEFNQPLNFDISKATNMSYMFNDAKAFRDKYNSGEPLPKNTNDIKGWLNNNRNRMNDLDIKNKYGNQIDDFFSDITNLTKEIKR